MNCRKALLASVFAALAFPVFVQGVPRVEGGLGVSPVRAASAQKTKKKARGKKVDPLKRLQKVLRLTEAQVEAIKAQETYHKETLKTLAASAKEASGNVRAAIQGGNATEVGNAVLAVTAIKQNIKTANEEFKAAFNNVLTTTQQEKLTRLQKATRQANGLKRFLALARSKKRN